MHLLVRKHVSNWLITALAAGVTLTLMTLKATSAVCDHASTEFNSYFQALFFKAEKGYAVRNNEG